MNDLVFVQNESNLDVADRNGFLDKIYEIKVLDEPVKKQKELSECINLPKHMAEHIYMFSGESERVTMKIEKFLVNDVIDWFGKEAECNAYPKSYGIQGSQRVFLPASANQD